MQRTPYRVPEAERILGFTSRRPLYAAIHRQEIRAVKIGREYLLNADDVDALARGEHPAQVSP